ncbi:MAG: non-canonical purine NTP diphosphatase [Alloprevotella sp.]|nr:non-canonical purine NTP diphosphatase [Alloprevotella sp.]
MNTEQPSDGVRTLVFATNNEHKLSEVRDIFGSRYRILSLSDIGCHADIPETAETLEGNALQKVQYVHQHYGLDCFADDTGLEVDALDGRPGVHTARYAFPDRHDPEANTTKLLGELEKKSDRKARFRTVIALVYKGELQFFDGRVEGTITTSRRGTQGFGYDPVFQPDGYEETFAELGVEVKNRISHRARAVAKLVDFLGHQPV